MSESLVFLEEWVDAFLLPGKIWKKKVGEISSLRIKRLRFRQKIKYELKISFHTWEERDKRKDFQFYWKFMGVFTS